MPAGQFVRPLTRMADGDSAAPQVWTRRRILRAIPVPSRLSRQMALLILRHSTCCASVFVFDCIHSLCRYQVFRMRGRLKSKGR